jgi:HK97 family phage prohead protease/HK97 family phage major capsid protein
MSVIHKYVMKAEGDNPLEYVMSDATVDRYGDIVEPDGWKLQHFKRNPIALFGHKSDFVIGHWKDVRVEGGKLLGRLELLAKGISERLDEIRAAVEAGVLRAVSVGFRPLSYEPIEGSKAGGIRYKSAELVECSVVSIPANPNALAVAKQLHLSDDVQRLIFGETAEEVIRRDGSGNFGEPAIPQHSGRGKVKMQTLSERIQNAQDELVQLKDQLTNHVKQDDADEIVTEELSNSIEQKELTLKSLKRAESALAVKSADPEIKTPAVVGAPAIRRPLNLPGKASQPRDIIIRAAVVNALAHVTGKDPEQLLEQRYGEDEGTNMILKAAVSGATTTGTGWAAELVNTAMADFLETLRPISVYPTLANSGGGRLNFGANQGSIRIPSRAATPSIAGSFVGEGAPIPVRRLGLTSITLTPKKMGVISVFSREIARYSTPAIEALVRQEIEADTALTLDSLLLDDNAANAVRPAGLLNGVTPITAATGGGAAAILADIRALTAPFDAANAGRNLLLLMNPAQARAVAMTPGPDGTLGWSDPIMPNRVASTTVPVGRIILIDAADFVSATGDVPEFEMSNEAVLHMEDSTPAQISAGTDVAAPVQSMFQTAQIAMRMLLDVSWAMRRQGMVSYIDGVTW